MPEKYQALYRKWRPKTFGEVVGQEHITKTLKNELALGKVGHAYLFCGTRGTGKTSVAKIFARAVNCENPHEGEPCNICETCRGIIDGNIMDVYEMDAASNNGVDAIRNLREEVVYTPAGCMYKVYIIDEVHMLTTQAFNALLKTLEEPPEHALFILATTEPQKIPQTIMSRCQRYDFRRISSDDIARRLKKIASAENINATEDALELIAEMGDGSMRDALSILDRCSVFDGELRCADVSRIVGKTDESVMLKIASYAASGNAGAALKELDTILNDGKDPLTFFDDFIECLRGMLLCKECENPAELLEKTEESAERLKQCADEFTSNALIYGITMLGEYHNRARQSASPRTVAEVALIKLCKPEYSSDVEALTARVEKLETIIRSGNISVSTPVKSGVSENSPSNETRSPNLSGQGESVSESSDSAVKSASVSSGEWDLWPEVLEAIKNESKSLYMYIFKAKVEKSENVVNVELGSKFSYDKIATKAGIEYLSNLFSRIAGEELKARVNLAGANDGTGDDKPSIKDLMNKKQKYGDIIKIKGEL